MSSFPAIEKYNMFSENNGKIWSSERDYVNWKNSAPLQGW